MLDGLIADTHNDISPKGPNSSPPQSAPENQSHMTELLPLQQMKIMSRCDTYSNPTYLTLLAGLLQKFYIHQRASMVMP